MHHNTLGLCTVPYAVDGILDMVVVLVMRDYSTTVAAWWLYEAQ